MGLFDCHCCPRLSCLSCFCLRPKHDNIKTLDYSHCCLDDVPSNVFSHERTLEEVYLDANQIRDLPRALLHCEGLRRLHLSDNELQSIPSAISSLTKLEELNISKNHILQIPDSIKSCKCLRVVDASINPLGPRLPDGFTQLINLQELYLNDAFLEFLPANFGRLSRLQIVELRENHLKVLPKSMSRLVDLRRLDIGQNDFFEFPEVIGCLLKLTELWCDSNRIISIPSIIGSLKYLTYLDASYNKIEEIANELGECDAITDLTLTSNNITQLPESIGNLTKLNILRVDENEIKAFPTSIGSLTVLEELVFNENQMETLPSNIGLLRNLQTLIGDRNKLQELPDSIGSCMQLRILSLAENELKVLPDEIGRLTSLKMLNLNSNSLINLPFSLTKITNLQALWLSENQNKPLFQFQSEFDEESGQKVLTCYLLPQISRQTNQTSPRSAVSPNDLSIGNGSTADKQVIKFSADSANPEMIDDDLEDRITTKLIRAPTPYPKELKAHARHARNLALKQKDSNNSKLANDEGMENTQMILPCDESEQRMSSNGTKSSQFEMKEAKVSKAQKSPLNTRHLNTEVAQRPTSLPINALVGPNDQNNLLDSKAVELVTSKITKLLRKEELIHSLEEMQNIPHERKASYKVAVTNSASNMKSPVERKIKSKSLISKEDSERGYRSDLELYSSDKSSENRFSGYSSDLELNSKSHKKVIKPFDVKVSLKECDSDSALHMPYETKSNEVSHKLDLHNIQIKTPNIQTSINTSIKSCGENQIIPIDKKENPSFKTNPDLISCNSDLTLISSINKNSSIGSLCQSSGSERPSSYSSNTTTSQRSSISPNDISQPATDILGLVPALPPKPLNYTPLTQDTGIPTPPVSSTRSRPQTASSQFIIHKFSHDSYSQSKLTNCSNSIKLESIHQKWNANGINFADQSNESVTTDSLLDTNNHLTHVNNKTDSIYQFPVIIVKNPGLGFNIESRTKNSNGIFVSFVVENGPASTALKVGDKILQIDGIDLQNASEEKANHIFQSTGNTISLMVSREKS